MCGIYGFIGKGNTDEFIKKLSLLEYRGYDSCGIAYEYKNHIFMIKTIGNTSNLKKNTKLSNFDVAIGHTRWATHGVITPVNAHPFTSTKGRFYCVHNGVIDNYLELKSKYNIKTNSDTDSSIVPYLLDIYFKDNVIDALKILINELKGTFAIVILDKYNSNKLYFLKNKSPLLINKANDGISISSDQISFKNDSSVIVLNDYDYGYIDNESYYITNDRNNIERITFVKNDSLKINKQSNHYMLDEIYYQKELPYIINTKYKNIHLDFFKSELFNSKEIVFVGSGSSYYAASILAYQYEHKLHKRCYSVIASEITNFMFNPETMVILLSQSGETMDLCLGLDYIKRNNLKIFSLCNVLHSTLGYQSDYVFPLSVGREISVASTKAFMAMLYVGRGLLINDYFSNYQFIQKSIENALGLESKIKDLVTDISKSNIIFYIGSGIDYIYSLEGSLKLKEVSYLHSFSINSGELKHGSLALVDSNTYCIAILSQANLYNSITSSLSEVRSRGGKTLLISNVAKASDLYVEGDSLALIVIMQLISYYTALKLNRSIDQPRNLAKSVTVK